MYSLKIGLGGTGESTRHLRAIEPWQLRDCAILTLAHIAVCLSHLPGSNAAEPVKPHSAVSSGIHHPSAAAIIAAVPPTFTAPILVSPSSSSSSAAFSPSASSLLSRLASPSTAASAFSPSVDAALSHVIPVSISARPVPLTVAENAAEVKRQERRLKKAERRKAEKENSQPQPLQPAETDLPPAAADSDSAGAVAAAASDHSRTNGHSHAIDTAATSTASQQRQAGKASKAKKQRKPGDPRRALHDDEQLTLSVAQLKAIVAAVGEKVVRECCKQMTQLSAKQRKELQDSLVKEHASCQSSSLHQALHASTVLQAALRREEETEPTLPSSAQTVQTTAGDVEGGADSAEVGATAE